MPSSTAARVRLLVTSSASSPEAIVAAARESGARTLTPDRLHRLTTGEVPPTSTELTALAHALGVDGSHFTSDDTAVVAITEATAVLAAAARRQGVRIIGPCRQHPVRPVDQIALLTSLLLSR